MCKSKQIVCLLAWLLLLLVGGSAQAQDSADGDDVDNTWDGYVYGQLGPRYAVIEPLTTLPRLQMSWGFGGGYERNRDQLYVQGGLNLTSGAGEVVTSFEIQLQQGLAWPVSDKLLFDSHWGLNVGISTVAVECGAQRLDTETIVTCGVPLEIGEVRLPANVPKGGPQVGFMLRGKHFGVSLDGSVELISGNYIYLRDAVQIELDDEQRELPINLYFNQYWYAEKEIAIHLVAYFR